MYEIEKFFGHPGTVATLVAVNFGHSWGDFIKSVTKKAVVRN